MKRLLLGLSLIAAMLLPSCEKEENIVTAKFKEVTVSIADAGGTVDLLLVLTGAESKTYPYTATIEGEGFSITNERGDLSASGEVFTVTATANAGLSAIEGRTGTLTVNVLSQTLIATVTQTGKLVTVKFIEDESTIVATGGTADFVLELAEAGAASFPYTATIEGEGFSITNERGDLSTSSEIFTVTAISNVGLADVRTGTLSVLILGKTFTATVTQSNKTLNVTQFERDKGEAGRSSRANSYIIPRSSVNEEHKLSIERIDDYWTGTDPVFGGSDEANSIASNIDLKIKVLWADFDYAQKVTLSASHADKSMSVMVNDLPAIGGNMVVAVTKADGISILWSWHIWFSDIDSSVATELSTGQEIMDRNLGARSKGGTGVETLGLMYQWGRKDPFPNSAGIKPIVETVVYTPEGSGEAFSEAIYGVNAENGLGSIKNGVLNPFTYYTFDEVGKGDWVDSSAPDGNASGSKRWNTTGLEDNTATGKGTKTIFDPCPYGWRMPWGKDWNGLNSSKLTVKTITGGVKGVFIKEDTSGNAFFPSAGMRGEDTKNMVNINTHGFYWSGSPSGDTAYYLSIDAGMRLMVSNANMHHRASARSVRPVKE